MVFIKLGQIMAMHSDIYRSVIAIKADAAFRCKPMPFEEIFIGHKKKESYGRSWRRSFSHIDESCQGAASIGACHVKSGEEVVVKVQRKGIYERWQGDIDFFAKRSN